MTNRHLTPNGPTPNATPQASTYMITLHHGQQWAAFNKGDRHSWPLNWLTIYEENHHQDRYVRDPLHHRHQYLTILQFYNSLTLHFATPNLRLEWRLESSYHHSFCPRLVIRIKHQANYKLLSIIIERSSLNSDWFPIWSKQHPIVMPYSRILIHLIHLLLQCQMASINSMIEWNPFEP